MILYGLANNHIKAALTEDLISGIVTRTRTSNFMPCIRNSSCLLELVTKFSSLPVAETICNEISTIDL